MGVIYKIVNPKGKMYVGKTYNLKHRIASHKCATKKGRNIILHNSIKKYGWENHLLEVIEIVPDELLNEREIFWIATLETYCYKNPMGMNMTLGADGQRTTWMHDIERRKKMSEMFMGENSPFYGRKHTEENKRIIGEKAYKRAIERGTRIPQWGADKGREITSKPIIAYSENGGFIKEFISINQAAKYFNNDRRNISGVLCSRQVSSEGIIYRYKTENYPFKIDVSKTKIKKCSRKILLLNKMREIIKEYETAKEAAKDLHIPKTTIARAAQYNEYHPIRTGHIFKYKDEHILNQHKN